MNKTGEELYGKIRVELYTRADHNCFTDVCYANANLLQGKGLDVRSILPSTVTEFMDCIHVWTNNVECTEVMIESAYGNAKLLLGEKRMFKSGVIGLSYSTCEVTISVIPSYEEAQDKIMKDAVKVLYKGLDFFDNGLYDDAVECADQIISMLNSIADDPTVPDGFKHILARANELKENMCRDLDDDSEIDDDGRYDAWS